RHLTNQLGETPDIGFVEGRVHLVENAERAGLVLEDANQQCERGERLLAAREQQHILELLAWRRRNHIDAAFGSVELVSQAHEGLAAAEELAEGELEVLIDALERLLEFLPRELVNLFDSGLSV